MRRSFVAIGLFIASFTWLHARADGRSWHAQAASQPPATSAQPASTDTQPAGTAIIRGRILSGAAPLRRAQVRVTSSEPRITRYATTGRAGTYEFKDLPAGRYTLGATKASYLPMSYGQRGVSDPPAPVDLADGQVLERMDLTLPRGSVITGRVTDEFGEPIAGATIQVLRPRSVGGQRRFTATGTSTGSDETGRFRAYGLPPGEYIVSATLRASFTTTVGVGESTSYPPTYYPGTPVIANAQPVTVGTSVELPDISFAMIPARSIKVSGTVTSSSGTLSANPRVSLRQTDSAVAPVALPLSALTLASTGVFTIADVMPGEYVLEARSGIGATAEYVQMPLTVGAADIEGLALVTSKGASARGRVTFEGGMPASMGLDSLQVGAGPAFGSRSFVAPQPGPVAPDGTFEIRGLFGPMTLGVSPMPPGWRLKTVILGGREFDEGGYPFKGTDTVEGFEIVLTNLTTELNGSVADDKGRPVTDCTVVAYTTNRDKWPYGPRYVRVTRPDQNGRFKLTNLVPGDHYVIAIAGFEQGAETDPDVLERFARTAQRVAIVPGGAQSIAVNVVRAQ